MAKKKNISPTANQKELAFVELEEYLIHTKKWFLEGVSRMEMLNKIASLSSTLTEPQIHLVYNMTTSFFENQMIEIIDLQDIVDRHIIEYEKLYQYFDGKDNLWGKRKVMSQKEKLLGLMREENVVEFNQINNTFIQEESEYSLSKLDEGERSRVEELLNKIKVNNKND